MSRIRRWLPRFARHDDGNVTVEFALIGVFFFTLICMAIQGAVLFNAWLVISNAVEEGARYGAPCYNRQVPNHPEYTCSTSDISSVVTNMTPLDTSKLSVTVTSANGLITVAATYNVPIVAPFVSAFLNNPTPVGAESSMRLENGGS